jgi:hypothetical protein
MGGYLTTTWYTYGRNENDYWLEEPIDSTVAKSENPLHHMGKFKHKVFQLALGEKYTSTPKIYLYQGYRKAKCELTDKSIIVTFSDSESKKAWDTCRRSKLGLKFDEIYKLPTSKETYVYIFEKK